MKKKAKPDAPRLTDEETKPQAPRLIEDEWEEVVRRIRVDLESTARASKALQRRRQVRSASDLLRIVLAYALCDWPLNIVGLWAAILGLGRLSKEAVYGRLRRSRAWMGKLVAELLLMRQLALPPQVVRVRVIDASTVNQPGSKGTDWRVHVSIDLTENCIRGIEITDAKGGETLVRHPLEPDEICLVDGGYAHRRGLGAALQAGSFVVVRTNWQNLPMRTVDGESLDVVAWLRQTSLREPGEVAVLIDTPNGIFRGRLISLRLSAAKAEAARRRIRREARKKGHTPDQRTLEAAGYILVVTNLAVEQWSARLVLELYRVRWQIELTIKRLKSIFDLDHLRTKDPELAQVYLLGKVMAALLADGLSGEVEMEYADWFTSIDRPVSHWSLAIVWRDALWQAVRGNITLTKILAAMGDLGRYVRDSPRQRRQQRAVARNLLMALNRC